MGELGIDGLVFTSYEEAKESHGSKKFHKFYLVDSAGTRHLAATGEDTGDAHYNYASTKPFGKFGAVSCHNRREVIMWLEMIINETGGGGQGPSVEETTEGGAHERVYFVEHKNERTVTDDGRRVNKWYLIDQHGKPHLAVVGVERETKDGHYSYHAEEPFASIVPLVSTNLAGVFKWLERMTTHHHAEAHGLAGDAALITPAALAAAAAAAAQTGGALAIAAGRGKTAPRSGGAARGGGGGGGGTPKGGSAGTPKGGGAPSPRGGAAAAAAGAIPSPRSGGAAATVAAAVPPPILTGAAGVEAAASDAGGAAAAAPGGPISPTSGRPQLRVLDLALLQRLGGGKAAGAAAAGGGGVETKKSKQKGSSTQKNKPVGIVEQNQQKKLRKLQEDARTEEAALQANHLAALRRAAAAEAAGDAAARRTTLEFLYAPPTEDERTHMGHWVDQLKSLASGKLDAHQRKHGVRLALECLKELTDTFIPVALLGEMGAVEVVRGFTTHASPVVSSSARRLLTHWHDVAAGHANVLSCPAYAGDPCGLLEAAISAGRVPLPTLPAHRRAELEAAASASAAAAPRSGGQAAVGFATPGPPGKAGAAAGAGPAPASAPAAVGAFGAASGGGLAAATPGAGLLTPFGGGGALGAQAGDPMQIDG